MTDAALLTKAARVAGGKLPLSRLLGHNDASRLYAWMRGARPTPPLARIVCALIVAHPETADWLSPPSRRADAGSLSPAGARGAGSTSAD